MLSLITFFNRIGSGELIVIALIILLLFGGKKIPELMRGLGRGVREFRDASSKVKEEFRKGLEEGDEKSGTDKTPGE